MPEASTGLGLDNINQRYQHLAGKPIQILPGENSFMVKLPSNMKIVIIEDEIKAARSLAGLITQIRPAAQIIAQLQSVEAAIDYFSQQPTG